MFSFLDPGSRLLILALYLEPAKAVDRLGGQAQVSHYRYTRT